MSELAGAGTERRGVCSIREIVVLFTDFDEGSGNRRGSAFIVRANGEIGGTLEGDGTMLIDRSKGTVQTTVIFPGAGYARTEAAYDPTRTQHSDCFDSVAAREAADLALENRAQVFGARSV
jgi:hypothetical protein